MAKRRPRRAPSAPWLKRSASCPAISRPPKRSPRPTDSRPAAPRASPETELHPSAFAACLVHDLTREQTARRRPALGGWGAADHCYDRVARVIARQVNTPRARAADSHQSISTALDARAADVARIAARPGRSRLPHLDW